MSDLLDFAVVGGGASGVYSAWRLSQASGDDLADIRARIGGEGPLKIGLFERSSRIGGRLLSASAPEVPGETLEMGGMRFLDNQPIVRDFVAHRGIKHHPQAVGDPNNLAYLRRVRFRQNQLSLHDLPLPYNLPPEEQEIIRNSKSGSPTELIFEAVFKEFPQLRELSAGHPKELREWLRGPEATVDGKPLYQVGFWNLISRHLSHEGRKLAITLIGYDCLGANANAVDIIAENFDFTPDSKYYLFDEGFEAVLWNLADEFDDSEGCSITMHKELESFEATNSNNSEFALTFQDDSVVHARSVVLAMPQWAIKNLRKKGPLLNPDLAPHVPVLLNSVEGIPLYKMFLIYPNPWWEQVGVKQGRTLTDLPVRQCYYWYSDPNKGPSAIMVYNDQDSTSFWGGYQASNTSKLGPGDATQIPEGAEGLGNPDWYFAAVHGAGEIPADEVQKRRVENWKNHPAPSEMVQEMHRQIAQIHGVNVADIPSPTDAAFMDWANEPYGGAVHFWNPGYRSWFLKDKMTQPVEGLNAFIVGESYSTVQTWVEGAWQTSEIFLTERLGMARPAWLKDDDIGFWR